MPSDLFISHAPRDNAREAITARERPGPVLAIGAWAATSNDVRPERMLALNKDKVAVPLLRLRDDPLLPDELSRFRASDLRGPR